MPYPLSTRQQIFMTEEPQTIYLVDPVKSKWEKSGDLVAYDVSTDSWKVERQIGTGCHSFATAQYKLWYWKRVEK